MEKWQTILKKNIRKKEELVGFLKLDPDKAQKVLKQTLFSLNLPLRIAKKIKKNTLTDPLFRQFVPLIDENKNKTGFIEDPVCDYTFQKSCRLLQKYQKRVLFMPTNACAMHCRFCFRKHYDYSMDLDWKQDLKKIAQNTSLDEIILSGGDPLSLSNTKLKTLFDAFGKMSHIKRIRFHTKFIIGIPERIDKDFLHLLSSVNKQIYFIIHINHPKEFDKDILFALKKLSSLHIPLLTQTVLLKGINDQVDILEELFTILTNNAVLPYYLHQLDRVQGATHFEVPIAKGKHLYQELEKRLSGYALPKYVQEIPKKPSKTLIINK